MIHMQIRGIMFSPGHLKQRFDLAVRWDLVPQRLRIPQVLAPLWTVSGRRLLSCQVGLLLLLAGNGSAETFDDFRSPTVKWPMMDRLLIRSLRAR